MKKQIALAILSLAAINAFAATDEFTLTDLAPIPRTP